MGNKGSSPNKADYESIPDGNKDVQVSGSEKRPKRHERLHDPKFLKSLERDADQDDDFSTQKTDSNSDRFDYLIIFPQTEGQDDEEKTEAPPASKKDENDLEQNQVEEKGKKKTAEELIKDTKSSDNPFEKKERITWEEARNIWLQAVPGDDEQKEVQVEALAKEWMARFRSTKPKPNHTIPRSDFLNLAREVIVGLLGQKSGLQLKVTKSRNNKYLLCRIRAPVYSLEQRADLDGYRLQFKYELDPGYEFWRGDSKMVNGVKQASSEMLEEAEELDKDEANERLEQLYKNYHISPSDLQVYAEEIPKQWSTRVHALERMVDPEMKKHITNRYPAYAQFSIDAKLRHLYQTYKTLRGPSLFKSKDRLILTKAIIDQFFDVDVLTCRNVIVGVTALHDASYGDPITIESLQESWVKFWSAKKPYGPKVSDPCMDESKVKDETVTLAWYKRPFSQPLLQVREYFGERLALFFAWLGLYTYWLIFPAFVGVGFSIYTTLRGDVSATEGVDRFQFGLVLGVIAWAVIYKKNWDRECRAMAVQWGTYGFIEEEKDRPQFRGWGKEPRRRSPVTSRMETYYPSSIRSRQQFVSLLVIWLMILLMCSFILLIFWCEWMLGSGRFHERWVPQWGPWIIGVVFTIEIQLFNSYFSKLALYLNEMENYQTDSDFQANLVFKTFLFQIFNNYAALCFCAFFKNMLFGCVGGYCLHDVRVLMTVIFIGRFVGLLASVVNLGRWQAKQQTNEAKLEAEIAEIAKRNALAKEDDNDEKIGLHPFEKELLLDRYEGTFDGYAGACLQYGYVVMFMVALPIAPALALLENLIEIRLTGYKLTTMYRRPDPSPAEDVGGWGNIIEFMSMLAIMSNTGILVFTTNTFLSWTVNQKWLVFLVIEHVLLLLTITLQISISQWPPGLRDIIARQKIVVQKHFYGFSSDGGAASLHVVEKKGHIDITPGAVDSLARGPQGAKKKTEDKRIVELDAQLLEIHEDLNSTKRNLKDVMKTEVFNEDTGVGETKHGLPLGVLTVKLILCENIDAQASSTTVVISMRSTKSNRPNPGPPPQASKPAKRGKDGKSLEFNQMFTLAPIKSQDGEVVFDIMDKSAQPKRKGTAKILLRELANQQEQEKYLNIQARQPDGTYKSLDKALLFVKAQFIYSKIVPLKAAIFTLQDKKRQIEREITLRKLGQMGEET